MKLVIAEIFLFLSILGCRKENQTSRQFIPISLRRDAAALYDSMKTLSAQEQKKKMQAEMNSVTIAYQKFKPKTTNDKIINDEYSTFKLLLIIGKTIDRTGLFSTEMNDHFTKFTGRDKKNKDAGGKIVNGFAAIYSMYGTIANMYTQGGTKDKLIKEIDEVEESVQNKMHKNISAMEAVASMSIASYTLLHIALREADTSGVLIESMETIRNSFIEGEKVAESDEDKFLNGIFRLFELSQLWAFAIDPYSKENLSTLQNAIVAKSRAAEKMDDQISVAVEHLYYVTHIIAQGFLKRI